LLETGVLRLGRRGVHAREAVDVPDAYDRNFAPDGDRVAHRRQRRRIGATRFEEGKTELRGRRDTQDAGAAQEFGARDIAWGFGFENRWL
jgi:hypothetical protein